jgi:lipopolysaccharide export system protein LptA
MRVEWLFASLFCSLSMLAFPAHAEKADKSKPINLEADSVRVEDAKQTAIYEGHVVLTQGTLMMTAEKIELRQDAKGFTVGNASGSPVYFRQKMDGREELAEGWADRIIYDGGADKLQLSGQARLKRGADELRGSLIIYDAKTEFYQAQGSSNGVKGRVKAVIQPKNSALANEPSQVAKP